MELSMHQKTVKYIIYCLFIAGAALLQNTPGLFIEIGPARCFLIIPTVVILAMGEKEMAAAILGLVAGFFWDIDSAVHAGFNAIFFMLVCFFAAAVTERVVRNIFVTNMIAAIATAFVYSILYWLFFIIIKGVDGASDSLFTFYLPSAFYTTVVTPIAWFILVPIKRRLNKKKPVK